MKKLFQKVMRKKADSFPTSAELLLAVMKKTDLQELLSFCPDKRELYRAASLALGMEVDELIRAIAEKYDFASANRILPMDLELLPQGVSLEHFKRIGAIGVTKDHVLQGVVAVDPALVKKLFPNIERADIMLGSWERIQAALTESEKLYIESLSRKKEEGALKSDVVTQIFDYIWQEARKHGCPKVIIHLNDEETEYYLHKEEGKEAKGTVHANYKKAMLHILKKERERLPNGIITKEIVPGHHYELLAAEMTPSVAITDKTVKQNDQLQNEITATEPQQPQADPQQQLSSGAEKAPEQVATVPCNVVELPTHRIRKPAPADSDAVIAEADVDGHVLIIDDNKVFRDVLNRFLERKGITVQSVDRAQGVMAELPNMEKKPDLIICDMHIPGMNGLSFVGSLRNNDSYKELPVIMLSSDDTIETKLQCIGAGADLYLQKSDDPRLLCAHVVRFLLKRKKSEAA